MSAISAPRPAWSTNDAEDLLELYWERAYRFAAMITRNHHESADIAQEALLKVVGHTNSSGRPTGHSRRRESL
jgi:DNA-directed RNA polymerase specialized sigma24 family protein